MIWGVSYVFKFQPSEIWEMDMDDLAFWNEGTGKIAQWIKMGV